MTPQDLEETARTIEGQAESPWLASSGWPPWLPPPDPDRRGLGRFLDHTLLRAEATRDQHARLCEEALSLAAHAVCVNSGWVSYCAERLRGTPLRVASVVGFPLGASSTVAKVAEARIAIADGATELDMVLPIGRALDGDWGAVEEDIRSVVESARGNGVKVIIESAVLTPGGIVRACLVARSAGAKMVKTSTGFHPAGGATVEAVALMRRAVGLELGVKASGGIRTPADAVRMLRAGASRLGASGAMGWEGWIGAAARNERDLLD